MRREGSLNAKRARNNTAGVSLVEALVSVAILVVVILGMFQLFVHCSTLANQARNLTMALAEVQDKIEEMRNHGYSLLTADYAAGGTPGNIFDLTQLTGKAVIAIDSSNADLLKVRIVACWRNQDGRIIGEDKDLDGTLDAGEDLNGNGVLDSIAVIEALIARI